MRQVPARCSRCGQPNIHHLDYCAVCGHRFRQETPAVRTSQGKGNLTREQKLKAKRIKKRKELIRLYNSKKISREQFISGLRKLGYSTDIDKAEALKKYIREQIRAFEEMKVDPRAGEGAVYFDPNESRTDLPRDENGNVITDFSIPANERSGRPTENTPTIDRGAYMTGAGDGKAPYFGSSLFGESGTSSGREVPKRRGTTAPSPRIDREPPRKKVVRRIHSAVDWDDEEEEEEEEFEIDLSEGKAGESGWWDDDEWELEWTDEDESEFGDIDVEWDEEEEDEWELEEDRIEWDEEYEDGSGEDEYDYDETEVGTEEEGMVLDPDEEEMEDDDGGGRETDEDEEEWSITIRKRARRRNR